MPIEFAKISSLQLDGLAKRKVVFFFPVGPLEDHGAHLPLGLDLEEARRLCFLAAQRLEEKIPGWTGIIMPVAPLGIDSNTTRIGITVRAHVLRDWLVDAAASLMRNGFFHFVCFSGHLGPRQLTAIEDAGKIIRNKGRFDSGMRYLKGQGKVRASLICASSALVSGAQVLSSPFWPDPLEHGGRRDTSIALAIEKDLVDPQFKNLSEVAREKHRWIRNIDRRRRLMSGYWGSPADAEVEVGQSDLNHTLDLVFPKMRAVWDGADPNSLFRSWYSILPPNRSFYKAWILAVMICLCMAGWFFLNILTLP
jgi:creatinine amidohydrolase